MMTCKAITYMGADDVERTEDFYFRISRSEAIEMESSVNGGLSEKLKTIAAAKNASEIVSIVREFILKAYGVKSDDGRGFVKSPELSKAFYETEAYDIMFMEFIENPDKFADFVNAVLPKHDNAAAKN